MPIALAEVWVKEFPGNGDNPRIVEYLKSTNLSPPFNSGDESHLKVKCYLEGFPEPQIMLFDLNYSSRRKAVRWEDLEAKQPLP